MKKKKKASQEEVVGIVKKFFDENPEAKDLLPPSEDGFLFSKELRDAVEPFGKMDIADAIRSTDFMRALCKHAGISDEEFERILNIPEDEL